MYPSALNSNCYWKLNHLLINLGLLLSFYRLEKAEILIKLWDPRICTNICVGSISYCFTASLGEGMSLHTRKFFSRKVSHLCCFFFRVHILPILIFRMVPARLWTFRVRTRADNVALLKSLIFLKPKPPYSLGWEIASPAYWSIIFSSIFYSSPSKLPSKAVYFITGGYW